MKIQGMKPVDRGLLLAAVALALLGAVQSGPSAAPAPAFSSPLEAIASRPDLQVFSSLLARFPYLQNLLSSPSFRGTVFAPADSAWATSMPGIFGRPGRDAAGAANVSTTETLAKLASLLEPSLNPLVSNRESGTARLLWRILGLHVLVDSQQQQLAAQRTTPSCATLDMNNMTCTNITTVYTTLSGEGVRIDDGWWPKVGVVNKDGLDKRNPAFSTSTAKVVASIRVGPAGSPATAFVHVMDGVVLPRLTTVESYRSIAGFMEGDLSEALADRALLSGPWVRHREPALTLLWPTQQAFADWFAANRRQGRNPGSVEQLVADAKLLDQFVAAHIVPGLRLWAWDFLNVAVLGSAKNGSAGGSVRMLSGRDLAVRPSWSSANITTAPGATAQIVAKLVLSASKEARVTTWVDMGGQDFGCVPVADSDCGDSNMVLHAVDQVLYGA